MIRQIRRVEAESFIYPKQNHNYCHTKQDDLEHVHFFWNTNYDKHCNLYNVVEDAV